MSEWGIRQGTVESSMVSCRKRLKYTWLAWTSLNVINIRATSSQKLRRYRLWQKVPEDSGGLMLVWSALQILSEISGSLQLQHGALL